MRVGELREREGEGEVRGRQTGESRGIEGERGRRRG